MKMVLIILAENNFRDTEYIVPKSFFKKNEVKVMTASSKKISQGRFGFEVKNDFLFNEVNPAKFAGIFIVGGGGILDYNKNEDLQKLVNHFFKTNKIIGAICAAPRLLLNWGILKNKKFTSWNGDKVLKKLGADNFAEFTGKSTETDKNILTADGPSSVEEASLEFLKLLPKGK